ncbi:hypothetical protein ASG65_27665 [Bacillus sp. Leaf13]|nr:hypothetical protein ASG65_27665 [Bacillus sp. Leaf13]
MVATEVVTAVVTAAVTDMAPVVKNSMKKADLYWSASSNLIPISGNDSYFEDSNYGLDDKARKTMIIHSMKNKAPNFLRLESSRISYLNQLTHPIV